MSHEGKMKRGENYHKRRDIDGKYPEEVLNNPSRKADLDYFLENSKKKESKVKEKK